MLASPTFFLENISLFTLPYTCKQGTVPSINVNSKLNICQYLFAIARFVSTKYVQDHLVMNSNVKMLF